MLFRSNHFIAGADAYVAANLWDVPTDVSVSPAPGGRMAVISFHSLEDRIVKRFMQAASRADRLPSNFPIRAGEIDEATLKLVGRANKASDAEVTANPRSRSAVMRVAERTALQARGA